ncbi:MAG: hypothetical protein GY852_10525, partial [bacterium]|nr:hypothetical protein [bacterium]
SNLSTEDAEAIKRVAKEEAERMRKEAADDAREIRDRAMSAAPRSKSEDEIERLRKETEEEVQRMRQEAQEMLDRAMATGASSEHGDIIQLKKEAEEEIAQLKKEARQQAQDIKEKARKQAEEDMEEELDELRKEARREARDIRSRARSEATAEAQRMAAEMVQQQGIKAEGMEGEEPEEDDFELLDGGEMHEHFDGKVQVNIMPPVNGGTLLKILRTLKDAPGISILQTAGSWTEGSRIFLSLMEPLPIIYLLEKIDGVAEGKVITTEEVEELEDEGSQSGGFGGGMGGGFDDFGSQDEGPKVGMFASSLSQGTVTNIAIHLGDKPERPAEEDSKAKVTQPLESNDSTGEAAAD